MYNLIYQFIKDYLFNDTQLDLFKSQIMGQTITLNEWFSHSLSIISMILLFVFGVILIKWMFKLASGLFLLK